MKKKSVTEWFAYFSVTFLILGVKGIWVLGTIHSPNSSVPGVHEYYFPNSTVYDHIEEQFILSEQPDTSLTEVLQN